MAASNAVHLHADAAEEGGPSEQEAAAADDGLHTVPGRTAWKPCALGMDSPRCSAPLMMPWAMVCFESRSTAAARARASSWAMPSRAVIAHHAEGPHA